MYTKTENGKERPLYMWDTKGKLRGNADDVRRWEKFIPTCLDGDISYVEQSYDTMGSQSSSYGLSGQMRMDAGLNGKRLCGMNNLNGVTSFFPPCPSGMHCLRRTETFKGKTYFFGVCEQNVIEGGHEIEDGNDAIEMRGSYGPRIISDGEGFEAPTGYTQMWSPNAETVLRYKSNDLTSSFQDAQQFNGFNDPKTVHMVANVKVQAFNDDTLRVKLEHMRFYGRNGEVSMMEAHQILDPMSSGSGHSMHGAQVFKTFLEDPMLIFVKKGQAKNLLVSKNEPECITKIKQEVANGLLQNGQPQSLHVVKKTGIIEPMRMSTNVKKVDLM